MIPLSQRTERLVDALFADTTRDLIKAKLATEIAEDLPLLDNPTPESLERLRFACLKLASEASDRDISAAVALATTDWRDLLLASGFGYDVAAHDDWFHRIIDTT